MGLFDLAPAADDWCYRRGGTKPLWLQAAVDRDLLRFLPDRQGGEFAVIFGPDGNTVARPGDVIGSGLEVSHAQPSA